MTNLPAVRALMVLVFPFLGCLCPSTNAQILPFGPVFPTDVKQCQSFSKAVDAYAADYSAQHEKCLAENKPDRPDETHDSLVCSRSRCQYLHDYIYGGSILSVNSKQKEVSACFQKVREYQAEEARKAKERAEQKAQERKDEADEAAQRKEARDARDAQDQKRAAALAAREKADQRASEAAQKAESERISAQRQEHAQQSVASARQTPQANSKASQDAKASLSVADPFKDSESQSHDVAANLRVADPFPSEIKVADPFPTSQPSAKSSTEASEREKATFEVSSRAIELSTDKALFALDHDIAYLKSQSGQTINRAKANELIHEIQDTKSVLKTLNGIVTSGQYVVFIKEIRSAKTADQRDEAWGNLVRQVSSDALHSDLVKEGMTKVAPRLFGERVGLFLVGATGISVEAGGILLDSTKTGRDPSEVIRDSSGKVSLPEKQNALLNMWNGYERQQTQTNNSSDDALKRELWINSNIVYNQCLEAKADCERWRNLLNHK